MTNQTPNDVQNQFLDDLLQEAGFTKDDNIELLKGDLKPLLQERIMTHIYQELNEEQREVFTNLLNNNKINESDSYIRKIIPDYDECLMEIYSQFEDEYLESMNS